MLTEDYCSPGVSKLLSEKGLGKEHFRHYVQVNNDDGTSEIVSVCTHQIAMKFLREIHKISIDICTVQGKGVSYMVNIWDFANIHDKKYIGGTFDLGKQLYDFNTFEEAVEAALKHVLENLI